MTWQEKLHPRDGDGQFTESWLHKVEGAFTGAGATDLSALDSGVDWGDLYERLTSAKWGEGPDPALGEIYRRQGFHGKPEVVSEEELQRRVEGGDLELWRGLKDSIYATGAEHAEQMRSGDEHFPGRGVYGNGSYAATDPGLAMSYTSTGTVDDPGMLHMALAKDAKVIRQDEVNLAMSAMHYLANTKLKNNPDFRRIYVQVLADHGRLASLMGYDAMYLGPNRERAHTWVVFNRGKLSVVAGKAGE